MITYAYERVSTKDQHLSRQDTAIKQFRPGIDEMNIFKDKMSGKNFEREQYQKMKVILEHVCTAKTDKNELVELVVEELDRLGRTYDGVKEELKWFKDHGIIVRILEIPTTLTDVTMENKWVVDMVTNVMIEVYASVAQQELEKRLKRQTEGIAEAKAKGVKFGRHRKEVPEATMKRVYDMWKSKKLTSQQAADELEVGLNTFYRRVEEYESANDLINLDYMKEPYDMYIAGRIDDKMLCKLIGIPIHHFNYYIKKYEKYISEKKGSDVGNNISGDDVVESSENE